MAVTAYEMQKLKVLLSLKIDKNHLVSSASRGRFMFHCSFHAALSSFHFLRF